MIHVDLILVDQEKCIRCGVCAVVCQNHKGSKK
jgi:Fe-S-cluster-containing hydrogenase component 2